MEISFKIILKLFKILQIVAWNFKLSLIVLSCLPETANKKRKIGNSFRNTCYENKLSKVVNSIERWLMDASSRYFKKASLQHKKKPAQL